MIDQNNQEKLRKVFETIDAANALAQPLTRSIENMLRLSAASLHSADASVLVRDGDDGGLRFLSATGQVADRLQNVRIPAGKGIAGFVFSSGQPMAVADVGREQSFYAEVDKQTGYNTQTILATPLRYNDEVIGVLEYVNRASGAPSDAFTPAEMDQAALYADAVASLVYAYESAKGVREMGSHLAGETSEVSTVREWLKQLRDTDEHREMLELAVLIREVASRGPSERKMCREILDAVLTYTAAKSDTSFLGL
jgi:signal transduction protein with GAF and PtsI domain